MVDIEKLLTNDVKVYVQVNEDRMPDGSIQPNYFIWKDEEKGNLRCDIIRVKDKCRSFSRRAGGYGIRYTIDFSVDDDPTRYTRYLFYEKNSERFSEDRWFLEKKRA